MPRFAANLGFLFAELPFERRFGAAAAAGFAAVEFAQPYDREPREIAELLEANALAMVLFNLPMGDKAAGDFGIACLPGREDEFREGVASAIAYARALGNERVNCIAGKAPAGAEPALARATLRLSFGLDLSLDDAERAARIVAACVGRARGGRGARVGHAA